MVTRVSLLIYPVVICVSAILGYAGTVPPILNKTVLVVLKSECMCGLLCVAAMKNETATIMAQAGLRLKWHHLGDVRNIPQTSNIILVKLLGTCNSESGQEFPRQGPLGWTDATDGDVLPFISIAFDRVRWMAASSGNRNQLRKEFILGRALGRVLAHEMYHALARTTRHADSGVAKSLYTPFDFICDRLTFSDRELGELQQAVLPEPDQVHMSPEH